MFIPEAVERRPLYTTPHFEREITLPDRTRAMVRHLATLLRRYGAMDKTMVFCVDMEHARLVARLLQDEFGPETGLDNYAVPIISEEGEEGRRWLEDLADSDKKAPVVATTAELLSTGVDVPPCKNIVFMKTLSSPILFKQIIGRGSRLDPATDKYWFRIIDFTGASHLFGQWDRPPGPPPEPPQGPLTAALTGQVLHADTGELLVNAAVSVRTGPNSQHGPIRTDMNGAFEFANLPAGTVALLVSGPGFIRRELRVETLPDEAIFFIEATGQQLTLSEYRDSTRQQVAKAAPCPRSR